MDKTPDTRNPKPETTSLHPVSSAQHPATSIRHPVSRSRPFIIPIFIPHAGCPHQCVFCNQVSISGVAREGFSLEGIRATIRQFLKYASGRRKPVQISFYGGNFLGLKSDEINLLLDLAAGYVEKSQVDSIRFSTRPDTIGFERLDMIKSYPVKTVELGVQSMDDQVLVQARRGHSAAETIEAVRQLKACDYEIGLQMMIGLPGDSASSAMMSAKKITALRPDFVRIYPAIVVEGSPLAAWLKNGTYKPLTLGEAVQQVKNVYRVFEGGNINVIRMGLQASQDLDNGQTILAGPYHPSFGHLVYSEIFYDAARNAINSLASLSNSLTISVNPRSISKMRGMHNRNIEKLKTRYGFKSIKVVPDESLGMQEVMVG
jgi:histone acetyltransferase (RNA polymerase elongator complex component)